MVTGVELEMIVVAVAAGTGLGLSLAAATYLRTLVILLCVLAMGFVSLNRLLKGNKRRQVRI